MTKLKPKYKTGDRAGIWTIVSVNYRGEQFGYVYDLEWFKGAKKQKLTCTENILDSIVEKTKSALKL